MSVKSSRERDRLEQLIINVISVCCLFYEYDYGGANFNVICVSVILLGLLLCLFHIWNKLEAIRFMIDFRFEKDFMSGNDD